MSCPSNLLSSSNAFLLDATLSNRSTDSLSTDLQLRVSPLTGRNDNPEGVHEEIVDPEVNWFRPRIRNVVKEVVVHAGGIV